MRAFDCFSLFTLALAGLFLLPLLWLAHADHAQGDDDGDADSPYELRRKEGKCLCHTGFASSWQYLRSPLAKAARTTRRSAGSSSSGGDCSRRSPVPRGTSGDVLGQPEARSASGSATAYSYGIQCSECWKDDECGAVRQADRQARPQGQAAMLEKQMKIEAGPEGQGPDGHRGQQALLRG